MVKHWEESYVFGLCAVSINNVCSCGWILAGIWGPELYRYNLVSQWEKSLDLLYMKEGSLVHHAAHRMTCVQFLQMLLEMMIWQGIVGDPGERGTSGEKGQPVSITSMWTNVSSFCVLFWILMDIIFCLNLWTPGDPRAWWQSWHHWTEGESQPSTRLHLKVICLFKNNDSVSLGHYWRSGLNRQRWWSRNRGIIFCWQRCLNREFEKQCACCVSI